MDQLTYDETIPMLDLGDDAMVGPKKEDVQANALWHGIPIEGFNGPGEEMIRAAISRVPPELLTNVHCVKAAPELQPKHGRYDPETHTVNINPLIFNLRQRFGEGQGWIYHTELCVVHEIGHSIYYFFPEKMKDKWRDISGWMIGTEAGQAPAYKEARPGWPHDTSKWTHKKGVKFTRKYAQKNDDEDFADSFAFVILGKPHQMEPAKRDFIQKVIEDRVKQYPQPLIEGPTKPYGERDLNAGGPGSGCNPEVANPRCGRPFVPDTLKDTLVGKQLHPEQYHDHAMAMIKELDKMHEKDATWKDNVETMRQTMANFPFIHTAKATIIPSIIKNGIEPAHKYNAGLTFDKIAGLDKTVFMRMGQAGGGGQGAVGVMIDPSQLDQDKLVITRLGLMTLKQDEEAMLRTPGDHLALVAKQLQPYMNGAITYDDLPDVQSRLLVNGYEVDHPDFVGKRISPSDILENDHGEMEVKYADNIPSKAIMAYFAGNQLLKDLGGKSAYDYLKGKVPDDKLVVYEGEGIHPLSMAYRQHYASKSLKAYGTSDGVTKAWDTRGRGRHPKEKPPSLPKVDQPSKEAGYVGPKETFYHGTISDAVKGILEKGALAQSNKWKFNIKMSPEAEQAMRIPRGYVYITKNKETAMWYAKLKAKYEETKPGDEIKMDCVDGTPDCVDFLKPEDAPAAVPGEKPSVVTFDIPMSKLSGLSRDPSSPDPRWAAFRLKGQIPKDYISNIEQYDGWQWKQVWDTDKHTVAAEKTVQVYLVHYGKLVDLAKVIK